MEVKVSGWHQLTDDGLCGWVPTLLGAIEVKQQFELFTSLSFVCGRHISFQEGPQQKIRFAESFIKSDGTPFILSSRREYGCMFGRDKHAYSQKKAKAEERRRIQQDHPIPKKKQKRVQSSRKMGCPASLEIREVVRFVDFQVDKPDSEWKKKRVSQNLREALAKGEKLRVEVRFYVKLPQDKEHLSIHSLGQVTGLMKPIDSKVSAKLAELVGQGIHSVGEMRRHLKIHVETIMFPDPATRPLHTDAAFYPTDVSIGRHIYITKMRLRYSILDQDNVQKLVAEWQEQRPDDKFHLSLAASIEPAKGEYEACHEDEDITPMSSSSNTGEFFFCHQSKFQRHLLHRYGNDICFLDATYRTTKYALPLFFLAVKTNVGYSVVGEFVVQSESKAAIQRGLQTIRTWMAQHNFLWEPKCFMMDFCEREISATEELFPDTRVYICDFHREQAWMRWTSKVDNGVSSSKEKVLGLLRAIAYAPSESEYRAAVQTLQISEIWTNNTKLQRYVTRIWLSNHKRWAWAYRTSDALKAHTNNGLERQNHTFKHKFLSERSTMSLSGMLTSLITDYLRSRMRQYIMENVKASSRYGRIYKDEIPQYLHDRPYPFIKHCLARIESSMSITSSDVTRISEAIFEVKSETGRGYKTYKICLSPSVCCECPDWMKWRLPCKHLFAVLSEGNLSWDSLPHSFTASPFHTLDTEIAKFLNFTGTEETCVETVHEGDIGSGEIPSLPQGSRLNRLAVSCREKIHLLQDFTYLFTEEEALICFSNELDKTLSFLRRQLPIEGGLVLEREQRPQKTKKRGVDTSSSHKKTPSLPLHRKRRRTPGVQQQQKGKPSEDNTVIDGTFDLPEDAHRCSVDAATGDPPRTEEGANDSTHSRITSSPRNRKSQRKPKRLPRKPRVAPGKPKAPPRKQKPQTSSTEDVMTFAKSILPPQFDTLKHSLTTIPGFPEKVGMVDFIGTSSNPAISLEMSLTKEYTAEYDGLQQWIMRVCKWPDTPSLKRSINLSQMLGQVIMFSHKNRIPLKEAVLTLQALPGRSNTYLDKFPGRRGTGTFVVNNTTISQDDFQSLCADNELHDQVIHAYLGILKEKSPSKVFILPAFLPIILQDNALSTLSDINQWLYTTENFLSYEWILLPVWQNSHWALLAARVTTRTVTFLDSIPNEARKESCKKFWMSFMQRREELKSEGLGTWEYTTESSNKQTNSTSCGVHVLMNADALTHGLPPVIMRPCHVKNYRIFVAQELVKAGRTMKKDAFCSLPFCSKPSGDEIDWVECGCCKKWYHLVCLRIIKGLPDSFSCPFCLCL